MTANKRPLRPAQRKFLFALVTVLLKLVDFGLKRASYRRVSGLMLRLSPRPDPKVQNFQRALQWGWLINGVAEHREMPASCLRRTLLHWWILRWLGVPSDIRVGVNTRAGHAWLEHQGFVVNDHPDVVKQFPIIYTDELTPEKLAQLV